VAHLENPYQSSPHQNLYQSSSSIPYRSPYRSSPYQGAGSHSQEEPRPSYERPSYDRPSYERRAGRARSQHHGQRGQSAAGGWLAEAGHWLAGGWLREPPTALAAHGAARSPAHGHGPTDHGPAHGHGPAARLDEPGAPRTPQGGNGTVPRTVTPQSCAAPRTSQGGGGGAPTPSWSGSSLVGNSRTSLASPWDVTFFAQADASPGLKAPELH